MIFLCLAIHFDSISAESLSRLSRIFGGRTVLPPSSLNWQRRLIPPRSIASPGTLWRTYVSLPRELHSTTPRTHIDQPLKWGRQCLCVCFPNMLRILISNTCFLHLFPSSSALTSPNVSAELVSFRYGFVQHSNAQAERYGGVCVCGQRRRRRVSSRFVDASHRFHVACLSLSMKPEIIHRFSIVVIVVVVVCCCHG